jgi:hypothetical protein
MKIHAFISIFFLSSITAFAQTPREEIVSAEYTYTIRDNENITFADAKRKCIELAQAEAIRNKYGEIITSDFIDSRVNKDGESSDSYYWENTVARAKGVWLGNSEGFPKFDVAYSDGFIVFTAKVQGLAREIIQSTIDLKWSIMKDGINDRVTAETFDSGERFYVNFRSPADGYVAVYLLEGDDVTSCLLPYSKDPDGRCPVKAGRDYVFFDKNTDSLAPHYVLKTKHAQENNQLIIIYSPNSFTKCNDKVTEKNRPRSLNTSEFQKWLLGCQRLDNDMVVNKKWIKIDNKQQ